MLVWTRPARIVTDPHVGEYHHGRPPSVPRLSIPGLKTLVTEGPSCRRRAAADGPVPASRTRMPVDTPVLPFDAVSHRVERRSGRQWDSIAVSSLVPFDGQASQAAERQRRDMVQVLPCSQAKTGQAAQCLERDAALQPG